MSTATTEPLSVDRTRNWLRIGVIVGLVIGVLSSLLFTLMGILPTMGTLIGMPTLLGGWLLNLVTLLVLAIVFAAALSRPGLARYAVRLPTVVALGLAYGVVVWVVLDGFVFTYLAQNAGLPGVTVPTFAVETLVEDLVFGVVFGVVYYATVRWLVRSDGTDERKQRTRQGQAG